MTFAQVFKFSRAHFFVYKSQPLNRIFKQLLWSVPSHYIFLRSELTMSSYPLIGFLNYLLLSGFCINNYTHFLSIPCVLHVLLMLLPLFYYHNIIRRIIPLHAAEVFSRRPLLLSVRTKYSSSLLAPEPGCLCEQSLKYLAL